MSLLANLKERFTKAQERRQELEQTLEERREAAEKAKALELQIEAEEWAEKAPALLMELQEILGALTPLYFQFEMAARLHLNEKLFQAPARAYQNQTSVLSRIYAKHGAEAFSIWTGRPVGQPSHILASHIEGASRDSLAAQIEQARRADDGGRSLRIVERMIAARKSEEEYYAKAQAPEWLPRMPESKHHGVANATVLRKAWEAKSNG